MRNDESLEISTKLLYVKTPLILPIDLERSTMIRTLITSETCWMIFVQVSRHAQHLSYIITQCFELKQGLKFGNCQNAKQRVIVKIFSGENSN